jgi:ribonuclease Z
MFGITILGNNSALPAYERHPTSQVITLGDQVLLIDCGEGTQMQLAKYKVKRGKLNHIFISHLHGDHYFGLIGLITSMGLLGRENPLFVHAPAPLKEIIDLQLAVAATKLPFELVFYPLEKEGIICDQAKFSVEAFTTQHRIPCWGFIIREKKSPRKIDKTKAIAAAIPAAFYNALKNGEDYTDKAGEVIPNELVTVEGTKPVSYAFCADTIYDPLIAEKTKGVTVLYHETTYLQDLEERAAARYHSTTVQAATIAASAGVEQLLIGHFSSKYEHLDAFLAEACEVFPNTKLALEGLTFIVK